MPGTTHELFGPLSDTLVGRRGPSGPRIDCWGCGTQWSGQGCEIAGVAGEDVVVQAERADDEVGVDDIGGVGCARRRPTGRASSNGWIATVFRNPDRRVCFDPFRQTSGGQPSINDDRHRIRNPTRSCWVNVEVASMSTATRRDRDANQIPPPVSAAGGTTAVTMTVSASVR